MATVRIRACYDDETDFDETDFDEADAVVDDHTTLRALLLRDR